jgi:hypothetical protein
MNSPVDDLLKFIADTRAQGIPEEIIFRGIQAAVLHFTELEMGGSVMPSRSDSKPLVKNRVVGFTR